MLNNERIKDRLEFWNSHIKRWEESNLSQSEYSRRNNISKQQLSKWKIKIAGKEGIRTKGFVEVSIGSNTRIGKEGIELHVNDKYRINIKEDFDPEILKKIVKTLEAANK